MFTKPVNDTASALLRPLLRLLLISTSLSVLQEHVHEPGPRDAGRLRKIMVRTADVYVFARRACSNDNVHHKLDAINLLHLYKRK
jgi:hypothetical protein